MNTRYSNESVSPSPGQATGNGSDLSLVRAHIYNLFAQMARSPVESHDKLPFGWERESLDILTHSTDLNGFDLDGMEALLRMHRETDPEELEKHYRELFGEEEQQLHIPIEEHCVEDIPAGTRDELRRIYDYFGFRPFEIGSRSADHLSVELDFMRIVTLHEAMSEGEEKVSYALVQRDFLERHMLRWFPTAAAQVIDTHHDPFYPRLFQLLSEFLVLDANWRRQSLAPDWDH